MLIAAVTSLLLVCSDEMAIDASMLAMRIASVEKSIERFEIAGERKRASFDAQLTGDENLTMDWSALSSVTPEYDPPHSFIVERDFTKGTLYYCSGAKTDAWQEYHASKARCLLFHHNLEDVFPTAMLSAGLFEKCRDDASPPPRWDLIWLKPIIGASISEAILQTQDQAMTASWPEERFRVNSIKGEPGHRTVDISVVYLHKTLDRRSRISVEAYRLLLAEEHDFSPLVLCPLRPLLIGDNRGKMIDGEATSVIMYGDYRNVDGVPVPHLMHGYTLPYKGVVTTVRTELQSVKLNEKAVVRENVEIPVGSSVIDSIQGKSYRQGDQGQVIDEAVNVALDEAERVEAKVLEERNHVRNGGTDGGTQTRQLGGRYSIAIALGIALGLSLPVGLYYFRKTES